MSIRSRSWVMHTSCPWFGLLSAEYSSMIQRASIGCRCAPNSSMIIVHPFRRLSTIGPMIPNMYLVPVDSSSSISNTAPGIGSPSKST